MKRRSWFGWLEFAAGIVMIIFGIYTIAHPGGALQLAVALYALLAVLTGIIDIMFYIRGEQYIGFGSTISLITGVLSVVTGIMLLIYPGAGTLALRLLFPIWFIAHCISRLSRLDFVRHTIHSRYWSFSMVINIFGLVVGVLLLLNPFIPAFTVTSLIGLYLILAGVDSILLAGSRLGKR